MRTLGELGRFIGLPDGDPEDYGLAGLKQAFRKYQTGDKGA
jgi:hypothetical protein